VTGQAGRLLGDAFRSRWYVGLRAALSVGVPLLVGVSAGRASWGALASIGSFAGSASAPTILDIIVGPSASFTTAMTYGASSSHPGAGRWLMT